MVLKNISWKSSTGKFVRPTRNTPSVFLVDASFRLIFELGFKSRKLYSTVLGPVFQTIAICFCAIQPVPKLY